jgi:hypothetical protein
LAIDLPGGHYMVEMTPVPDRDGTRRGVVARGPVGLRFLGRIRIFQYEVRRWRDGVVPDLRHAVASPVRIADDPSVAQRIFDLLPRVPTAVWGRDALGGGEMWTCNSIVAWTLASAGVDLERVPFPIGGRAPGWDAGREVAARLVGWSGEVP